MILPMKCTPKYLNVYDALNSGWVLINLDAVETVSRISRHATEVRLTSGNRVALKDREFRRFMRYMNARHAIR